MATKAAVLPPAGAFPGLRRLPVDWVAPPLAPSLSIAVPGSHRVSDAGHHVATAAAFSLRTEEGRVIGTIVHGLLERIALDGPELWPAMRLANESAALREVLISSGIPAGRAELCLDQVFAAVGTTLHSPRGRWLLGKHREAACELAISGVVDGLPEHAVIDRLLVDEDDVCWIVDYKTSKPEQDESQQEFLAHESERYRPQLEGYKLLVARRYPHQRVRTALYFPLVDAWCEID